MTPRRVRWECPNGCAGVLGPQRPRRDDVRRYCLACSAQTGRLVERTAPTLERQRAKRAEAAAAKRRRRVERETQKQRAHRELHGVDLIDAWQRMLRLPTGKLIRREPELVLRRARRDPGKVTGYAWTDNRVTVTIGVDADPAEAVGTLLHELAHIVCMQRNEPWHDGAPRFARRCHELHDEWNARHSKIVEVSTKVSGAYAGKHRRR